MSESDVKQLDAALQTSLTTVITLSNGVLAYVIQNEGCIHFYVHFGLSPLTVIFCCYCFRGIDIHDKSMDQIVESMVNHWKKQAHPSVGLMSRTDVSHELRQFEVNLLNDEHGPSHALSCCYLVILRLPLTGSLTQMKWTKKFWKFAIRV